MGPYEIWITDTNGREYVLVDLFTGELGLSDNDVKTAAVAALQDLIDKINDPTPDTIVVKKGLITPAPYHLRVHRLQKELEE